MKQPLIKSFLVVTFSLLSLSANATGPKNSICQSLLVKSFILSQKAIPSSWYFRLVEHFSLGEAAEQSVNRAALNENIAAFHLARERRRPLVAIPQSIQEMVRTQNQTDSIFLPEKPLVAIPIYYKIIVFGVNGKTQILIPGDVGLFQQDMLVGYHATSLVSGSSIHMLEIEEARVPVPPRPW